MPAPKDCEPRAIPQGDADGRRFASHLKARCRSSADPESVDLLIGRCYLATIDGRCPGLVRLEERPRSPCDRRRRVEARHDALVNDLAAGSIEEAEAHVLLPEQRLLASR